MVKRKPKELSKELAPTRKFVCPVPVQEQLIAKRSAGMPLRQLAQWLSETHGIHYSHITLMRFLDRMGLARKALTEQIITPFVEKSLQSDVEILEASVARLRDLAKRAKEAGNLEEELKIMDRINKFLTLSFKVKGIGVEDKVNATHINVGPGNTVSLSVNNLDQELQALLTDF